MMLRLLELWAFCSVISRSAGFLLDDAAGQQQANVEAIKAEVRQQTDAANHLINLVVNGSAKGQLYNRLSEFVDIYGSRIAGSQNLENAIEYIMLQMKADGLENVHGEIAKVSQWVRGDEEAYMVAPRRKKLAMLGLGTSVATPTTGIQAEVLVVKTFEELKQRADEAVGKIVVYNQDWAGYGVSGRYRWDGAAKAAEVGAVATLIRSVTPFSINSPHTGAQTYNDSVPKIPTACITVEDAQLMWRMAQRGHTIEVFLNMSAQTLPQVLSRNVISEIVGSKYPDQVVAIGGHIDSWDVGQGAMDDGAGSLLGWQVISMMKQLGLRPKRTVRSVMFTAEEFGYFGANEYFKTHKDEVEKFVFVAESDYGTFRPKGLAFGGNADSQEVMREVMALLTPINASYLTTKDTDTFDGGEFTAFVRRGVPGAYLDTYNDKYFYFHHTDADTMDVLDPGELDLCAAVWAVMAYTIANIEHVLPRNITVAP